MHHALLVLRRESCGKAALGGEDIVIWWRGRSASEVHLDECSHCTTWWQALAWALPLEMPAREQVDRAGHICVLPLDSRWVSGISERHVLTQIRSPNSSKAEPNILKTMCINLKTGLQCSWAWQPVKINVPPVLASIFWRICEMQNYIWFTGMTREPGNQLLTSGQTHGMCLFHQFIRSQPHLVGWHLLTLQTQS